MDLALLVGIPLAGIMIFLGLLLFAASFAQVGALVAWEAMEPDINKLNPIKAKQMYFSVQGFADFVKALLKIAGLGFVVHLARSRFASYRRYLMHPAEGLGKVGEIALFLVFSVAALLAIIATIDVFYVRWKYTRDLMMSLRDIRDETKGREGSPEVRSKRRQKQVEMSQQRLGSTVPTADVVVTNPTHFAVAIKYDMSAMGRRWWSLRDRWWRLRSARSREHGVAVVENRYRQESVRKVRVGAEIPESRETVAEVLKQVDHIRRRGRRSARPEAKWTTCSETETPSPPSG